MRRNGVDDGDGVDDGADDGDGDDDDGGGDNDDKNTILSNVKETNRQCAAYTGISG